MYFLAIHGQWCPLKLNYAAVQEHILVCPPFPPGGNGYIPSSSFPRCFFFALPRPIVFLLLSVSGDVGLSKYGRRIRRQGEEEEGGTREMSDYRLGLFLLLLFFLSVIDEGHMQQLGTASFTAWAHLSSGLPSRFTWEVKLSCNTVYM